MHWPQLAHQRVTGKIYVFFTLWYSHFCRRPLLEYGTLQDHIEEILAQYDEEPKPGMYIHYIGQYLF